MARHHLTLAALSLLALSPFAQADKIWLAGAQTPTPAEGQAPDYLHGVVTAETKEEYTVRVSGGTVVLPRSQVAKVEKDGLTVAQLEESEKEMRKQVAEADSKRGRDLAQWADAALQERTAANKEEPPQTVDVVVDFKALIPSANFRFYVPYFAEINLDGLSAVIEEYLRSEIARISPRYDAIRHVARPASDMNLRRQPNPEPVQDAVLNPVEKK